MADLCMVRSGHTTLTHSISVGGKIIVVSADTGLKFQPAGSSSRAEILVI